MAYGLYLAADQQRWFRNDFSDEDKLTGTIYTDINQVTAKDLTGYTIAVKLYRETHIGARFDEEASAVVAANGTWSYAVTDGDMPPAGLYLMKVELIKSGTQVSTLNRVEFEIIEGPAD
jgi:hypothetical protein